MTGIGESSYRRYLAKDAQTLEMLVRTYSDALVRYAYCYVGSASIAEEVMEDAFAAYIVKNVKFETLEQCRAWLYRAVRSRAVDYLRRHKREMPLEEAEQVQSAADLASDLIKRERNAVIYRCMQALPQQYRVVLELQYFDEFEIPQICKILRKTNKQVYNLLSRARIALKELLIKEGITHEDL